MRRLAIGIVPVLFLALEFISPCRAETPQEEIVGTWLSQDADKEPAIFEKDGKFQCGFIKKDGKWVMANGTYTISDDGKVKASATYGGAKLGLPFTLKSGVLYAPRGPNPSVQWKKEK